MIKTDEDALVSDLAETYRIYDYKQLPLSKVAVFAVQLKDDSRIKMKLSNLKVPLETLLLAGVVDNLTILNWRLTGGQKGKKQPTLMLDILSPSKAQDSDTIVFSSGEEFEQMKQEIIGNIGKGGE